LPHVILTSDADWDPSVLDHIFTTDSDIWHDAIENLDDIQSNILFDDQGNYLYRNSSLHHVSDAPYIYDNEDVIDSCICLAHPAPSYGDLHIHHTRLAFDHAVTHVPPDYNALCKYFGWLPVDIIKKMFEHTTQFAQTPISTILKKHYKSPFPAFNVYRCQESVATDTIFSNTPAIDDGSTMAQIFVGVDTLVTGVYPMKAASQFPATLEDNIRHRGAMNKLLSDRAQVEISQRVQNLLRALIIPSWQSEPHQQHQNPAERRWQTVKTMTNTLLDRSGSPAYTWLLCLFYVCFLLNHAFNATINGVPLQKLNGSTPDISPLLRFYWWQPVYYRMDDSDFPSDSREGRGHWVGVAKNIGHVMTYKIFTDDTHRIIYRSNICPADVTEPNYHVDPLCG
jgi:hypothetical protein